MGWQLQWCDRVAGDRVADGAEPQRCSRIQVHSKNFPGAITDCGDVVKADIVTLPRADLYWGCPRARSGANAARGGSALRQLVAGRHVRRRAGRGADPEVVRSRALMEEVRGTCARWPRGQAGPGRRGRERRGVPAWDDWPRWIAEIRAEGYEVKVIAFNSMHAAPPHPAGAAVANRLYVAFWLRRYGRAPDWNKWLRPAAYCPTCDDRRLRDAGLQGPAQRHGRYGQTNGQYLYRCPRARPAGSRVIEPHVRAGGLR